MILTVLTTDQLKTYYRFYGARHSTINLGFKIDFEESIDDEQYLPKIRNILHLHETWLLDHGVFSAWQRLLVFLERHLRQVTTLDNFYFSLLEEVSKRLYAQDPKRTILEAYLQLLSFEGRFFYPLVCEVCHGEINDRVAFDRELTPSHPSCSLAHKSYPLSKVSHFFESKSTFSLGDGLVDEWFMLVFG